MKHFNDKWPRIIGIGTLTLLSFPINRLQQEPFSVQLLGRVALSLATVLTFWYVNRFLILRLRARFPERRQRWVRWGFTFAAGVLASAVVLWVMTLLRYAVLEGSVETFLNRDFHASISVNGTEISFMPFGLNLFQGAFDFLAFFILYEMLFLASDALAVRNNLQRKRSRVISNGVGLTNILTQYQMLGQELPTVHDDGVRFSVTVSLVAE